MAERIVFIFTESGGQQVVKRIKDIGDESKSSASAVSFLQTALGLLGSAATIKGITNLLDTYQNIQNRLGLVSKSQDEVAFSTQKLFEVANRSRSSFEATAELYARVALNAGQLGISHEQTARAVETLNKAVILSGASTREANAAILQFSQGLAGGVLRGQEMRSVMTQIPFVADLIAQRMGVTRGALRELGAQGKVTSQIMIDSLLGASDQIDKKFGKTFPTIGQQIEVLQNKLIQFLGDMNARFQIIPRVTALIDFLGEHMDTIARVVIGGALVLGLTQAIAAVNALTAALLANPIGAIAVLITAAVAALIVFSDQISLSAGSMATLADFAHALFDELGSDVKFMAKLFEEKFSFIGDLAKQIFGDEFTFNLKGLITVAARTSDGLVGLFVGAKDAIVVAWKQLPAALELVLVTTINKISELLSNLINFFVEAINTITTSGLGKKLGLSELQSITLPKLALSKDAEDTGKAMGEAFTKGFESVSSAQDLVKRLFVKAEAFAQERIKQQNETQQRLAAGRRDFGSTNTDNSGAKDKRQLDIDESITRLKDEGNALQGIAFQRRINLELVQVEQRLRAKGVELTAAEESQVRSLIEQNAMLKEKTQLLDAINGPMQDNIRHQQELNDLYREGKITVDQYTDASRKSSIAALQANRDATSGLKLGLLEVQDEVTNFSALSSKTVTDAFHGMEDAVVSFVKTGKLNFSSMVDAMLDDLVRLTLRLLVVKALGGLSGGGGIIGSIAGAALSGARATGGDVAPGRAYLVGERGPEIFTPGVSGNVAANGGGQGGGSSKPPQVTIVNVTDPEAVAAYLNTPDGQDVVVNVLRKNKNAVRQIAG